MSGAAPPSFGTAFGLPWPSGNIWLAVCSSTASESCHAHTRAVAVRLGMVVCARRAEWEGWGDCHLRIVIPDLALSSVDEDILLVLLDGRVIGRCRITARGAATGRTLLKVLLGKVIDGHGHDCCRSGEGIHVAPHACGGPQRELPRHQDRI